MSVLESVFTREYWKLAVWDKGSIVDGYDAAIWRMDRHGSVIRYYDYGRTTEFGWEIDHFVPVALGGTDELANLQPLHWRNNRGKGSRPGAPPG